MSIDRRELALGLAALPLALALPARVARAAGKARLVVVGGGPGGATVAVTAKRAAPDLDVTLIEPERNYTTCFYSNHAIGGFLPFERITHSYEGLAALGITMVHERAAAFDLDRREVRTESGARIAYDRLVAAPGIAFKTGAIEGYDAAAAEAMPHAWSGGTQAKLLKAKIEAMEDGGLVVIAPPRNPYRCPPGPYERACLIAHYLKHAKPRSKVIVVDPKMAYSKQPVFEEAIERYYKGIVDIHLTNDLDDMSLARIDAKTGEIVTKAGDTYKAAVANVIPDQTAGAIAIEAGLTDASGWCPIAPESFRSLKAENVYVVGDSAIAADMPKSAFSASNQARTVAAHILADLTGAARPAAVFRNTCWSMLAPDDSVKIGADYMPGEHRGKAMLIAKDPFVSQPGESAELRRYNYLESLAWYQTLVGDMFAKQASATGELPAHP